MSTATVGPPMFYEVRILTRYAVYVAGVWNTYRAIRLSTLDLIAWCGQQLEDPDNPFCESKEYDAVYASIQVTVEEICSSVTYHIHSDLLSLITNIELSPPSRTIGGLFLIWPLFVACCCGPIVPARHREWMKRKLRYIGTSVGLSQANSLADAADDPKVYKDRFFIAARGHLFMWSGSMFC